MKKIYLRVTVLLLCAVLLLTACGASEENTSVAEPQTEVTEAVTEEPVAIEEAVEPEKSVEVEEPEEIETVEPVEEAVTEAPETKELVTDFIPGTAPAGEGTLVGSAESDKYHYPDCRWVDKILPENEIWFADTADAEVQGYSACATCH